MTNKQQRQAHSLIKKLPNRPNSIDQAGRLVDVFLMNFNFETMTAKQHTEAMHMLEEMLTKYRIIRGR